jgi:uncharacterized protein (TIGR02646 family)
MIRVYRVSKPAILIRKEAEWRRTLLQAKTNDEQRRAASKYRHRQVREALEAMFHGKCAYCESQIVHVSDAHIEHYRPQSKFPHGTFDWDNLLLACGKCNSARYKGDSFPEVHEGGPLVNPCEDAPDAHLQFHYDAQTKLASVYGKTVRGETSEKLLGLNRGDLRHYRSRQITRLAALARLAAHDAEAQRLLDEARQDRAEYAAFARNL